MSAAEIGGYFGLEQLPGKEYHQDLVKLNTARNALCYLIRARKIRKVYLPYFLCDCVWRVCKRSGCQWEFYHIGQDLLPQTLPTQEEGAWLYVVNYYGRLTDQQILQLKAAWGNVIVDHVQDFYRRPLPGIDTLYSCRKFFGVPDGAYLSTDAQLAQPLPVDISGGRMGHVLGRFEHCASDYYRDFQQSDESFYDLDLAQMSPLTQNILRAVDYEAVRQKRNENYAFLHSRLGTPDSLASATADGPYCYPLYRENAQAIKRYLASQKIYVPTLWPDLPEGASPWEQALASNVLPLPCDQRYDLADMARILQALDEI